MKLVPPHIRYTQSFLSAMRKHKASGEPDGLFDEHTEEWFEQHMDLLLQTYANYRKGKDLEEGHVPSSEFWIVDGDEWLGRFSLRHTLNEELTRYGGNLGYYLIPSVRHKGVGTWAMAQVLDEAKKINMKKVLLTCYEDNIPSQKLIQKFGGVYQDSIPSQKDGKPLMRWWITL